MARALSEVTFADRASRIFRKIIGRLSLLTIAIAVAVTIPITGASAQALPKVRLATVTPNLVFSSPNVAIAKEYFKEQGLEAEISVAWGTSNTIAALTSGAADIIALGAGSVIGMASSADVPKSKIIASTNRVSLLLVGRKNISMKAFKWEMLKGKSVMGWPRGGDPGLMIERALRRMGLRAGRDIDHVTDLPIPARVRSWISGQADYAVFYEPFVTRFEKQGTGYAVASIAQATGNLDVGVFVATERFIREHPDRVQGWVSANRKALDWIRNNDAETVAKLLAPERRRWKLDELAGGFKRLREIDGWNWDLSISRRSISDWQSMMIESGVMRSTARLPYERLVDPRFFEAAAKIPMK